MNNSTKILIGLGVAAAITGVIIYVISQKATKQQFEDFRKESLNAGWDILQGLNLSQTEKALSAWKSKLSRKEAQLLIDNARKFKSASASDKKIIDAEVSPLIEKWLRAD